MIITSRIKIYTALAFGLYLVALIGFLDAFRFLIQDSHWLIMYGCLLLTVGSLEAALLFLLIKSGRGKGVNKLIYSNSFLITGFISGMIFWFLSAQPDAHFFPFISAFILSSLFPTIISILIFVYFETVEKFAKLSSVSLKEGSQGQEAEDKIFHLENANGKLLLEVPIAKIVCFEANDNYVVIYFLKNDSDVGKSMERISLRKIEDMLEKENVVFKRVHKSYLINPLYIEEVKGRAQAYKIRMKHFSALVPVSRSYQIQELNRY